MIFFWDNIKMGEPLKKFEELSKQLTIVDFALSKELEAVSEINDEEFQYKGFRFSMSPKALTLLRENSVTTSESAGDSSSVYHVFAMDHGSFSQDIFDIVGKCPKLDFMKVLDPLMLKKIYFVRLLCSDDESAIAIAKFFLFCNCPRFDYRMMAKRELTGRF